MKSDIIDYSKLIIRYCLFICPNINSTSFPASVAPCINASTNCLVFPFGRPPPNTTNIFFIAFRLSLKNRLFFSFEFTFLYAAFFTTFHFLTVSRFSLPYLQSLDKRRNTFARCEPNAPLYTCSSSRTIYFRLAKIKSKPYLLWFGIPDLLCRFLTLLFIVFRN